QLELALCPDTTLSRSGPAGSDEGYDRNGRSQYHSGDVAHRSIETARRVHPNDGQNGISGFGVFQRASDVITGCRADVTFYGQLRDRKSTRLNSSHVKI